ncbi:MAG: DegV family protein [Clostridia bacterium]|nr:DegV family protein [Clostridia bacterium]
MKKIAIITDSNSGLLPQDAPEGVFVLPMPFLVNGEPYFENINLTQERFYELLEEQASVSTSQPSVGDLTDLWTDVLKDYDELLHIPMSSGLSNSCATATTLAKDFDERVHVVDNHRISVSLKHSIFDAVKLREQGLSAMQIKEELEKNGGCGSIYIAVDSMKYLKKGGRVTPAAAMIGTILKIKPILQIHGEKLDKFALPRNSIKAREILKETLKKDFETAYAKYVEAGEMTISIAHSNNEAQAIAFAEELKKLFPNIPVCFIDPLSLSVACHIGPGSLGVAITRIVK